MLSMRTRVLVVGLALLVIAGITIASSLAEMDWPDRLAIQRFVNAQPGLSDALVDVGSGGRGVSARRFLIVTAWAAPAIRNDEARREPLRAEIADFVRQHWHGEEIDG